MFKWVRTLRKRVQTLDGEQGEKVVRSAKKFLLPAVGRAAAGDGLVLP